MNICWQKIKREELPSDYGLMESCLLQETNRRLMKGIKIPEDSTEPGTFSNLPRKTVYKGEVY